MPIRTHCHWMISAVDNKHYVNMEFQNIDVKISKEFFTIASHKTTYIYTVLILCEFIHFYVTQIAYWRNRIKVYDGLHEQHMKINEIYGNSYNKRLKSISSTGKSMFIDFKYQYEYSDENLNLIALIKYKKFNFDCQTWLDANKNILMSPNSPSNTNCSWMLSANFGSYIILNFTFIEVDSYS